MVQVQFKFVDFEDFFKLMKKHRASLQLPILPISDKLI